MIAVGEATSQRGRVSYRLGGRPRLGDTTAHSDGASIVGRVPRPSLPPRGRWMLRVPPEEQHDDLRRSGRVWNAHPSAGRRTAGQGTTQVIQAEAAEDLPAVGEALPGLR